MSFQIKDFSSIVLAQVNHARSVTTKVTDFQPGSVVRTIMEAAAVEIEQLYLQIFLGLRDAIPEATFRSFGFTPLPARVAHGFVSVSAATPLPDAIPIPIGTRFLTADGRAYASSSAVTWAAGSSLVRVPVACTLAGSAGNAEIGAIKTSPLFDGAYIVSNSLISNGGDVESDSSREVRFSEFIGSLSRGTLSACVGAVHSAVVLDEDGNIFEYVTRIGIEEVAGWLRLYIYSNGGLPSEALIDAATLRLNGTRDDAAGIITPGFRPAGVRVDVLPMFEREVDVSIQVGMLPGYLLNSAVRQSIGDLFESTLSTIKPGETMYLGTLIESLLSVPGVDTIVPVTESNVTCAPNEALFSGALVITAL